MFYAIDLTQEFVRLDAEESRHCIKVLRMETGDKVEVTDGRGSVARGEVLTADSRETVLRIISTPVKAEFPGIKINLAVAVTRHHDRFEWMLEKVTEAGVHQITPLLTQRSETRGHFKRSRWEKILLSAMKQSRRTFLPQLHEPITFKSFIKKEQGGLIAWCGDEQLPHLKEKLDFSQDKLNVLIGPEGDFTSEEFQEALQASYAGISLGSFRLRTETAAITTALLIKIGYE